jgi:anti-anti-sigma factor
MTTESAAPLSFEVEESVDEKNWKRTTITCHGRLVSDTAAPLKDLVKPLIEQGGHIVIDCGDIAHVDSSGLGVLVALKVSALNKGYCALELTHLSGRVAELLKLTHLAQFFTH